MDSNMTHYMELLASNQPWNLIIFMAIPVILAEFIAVTELFILLKKDLSSNLKKYNKIASIIAASTSLAFSSTCSLTPSFL